MSNAWEAVTAKYRIGARVRLNVGGPIMAIEEHNEPKNRIECMWFAGKRLHRGHFPPEALELLPEDAPSEMTMLCKEHPDCILF
jgi:uncharacterized protein YodC (DUF2158 family)